MKNKRGFVGLVILVLLGIVMIGGGYIYYKTEPTSETQQIVETASPPGNSPVTQEFNEHAAQAVLNELDKKRQDGTDAAVKSNLNTLSFGAEIYFGSNRESYAGLCEANKSAEHDPYLNALNATLYPNGQLICNVSTDGRTYAAQASLASGGYWCIDSTNAAKNESQPLGTATACR